MLVVAGGLMDQEKRFRDLKLRSLEKGLFFPCFYMLLLPLPLCLLVFWILALLIIKSSQLTAWAALVYVIFTVAVVLHALLDLSSMLSL